MTPTMFYVVKDDIIVCVASSLHEANETIKDLKENEKIAKLIKHKLFKKMLKKGFFSVATSNYKILVECDSKGLIVMDQEAEEDDF